MTQLPRAVAIALSTIGLLIGSLALYGVYQTPRIPSATPPPPPLSDADATLLPTASPRAALKISTSVTKHQGRRANYSLQIPAGWATINPADYQPILASLEPPHDLQLDPQNVADAFDLLAYDAQTPQQSAVPDTITVMATPRNALGFRGYLEATAAELAQAVNVETHIDHTLRPDGLPTGVLHYTTPDQQIDIRQAVLIDRSGANFIIVTMATAADQHDHARKLWQELVNSIELH